MKEDDSLTYRHVCHAKKPKIVILRGLVRCAGYVVQAVDMYAGAGKWASAHKVAKGYLSEQDINVSTPCVLFASVPCFSAVLVTEWPVLQAYPMLHWTVVNDSMHVCMFQMACMLSSNRDEGKH